MANGADDPWVGFLRRGLGFLRIQQGIDRDSR